MTKVDIVARIAQDTGIEKSIATTVIEASIESVRESITAGNEVFLRGLGSLTFRQKTEKEVCNFSKNMTIVIPAYHAPMFEPAKAFLDAIKGGK